MFSGQAHHTFDDKGRISVPARFRESLSGEMHVTHGFDRNLMVLPKEIFTKILQHLDELNITDPNARLLRRKILGNAYPLEIDSSGRVLIPQELRHFAGMENEAVWVGQGTFLEVLAPQHWQEQVTQIEDAEANAKRFIALDLPAS